jgi:hypothetical protein
MKALLAVSLVDHLARPRHASREGLASRERTMRRGWPTGRLGVRAEMRRLSKPGRRVLPPVTKMFCRETEKRR